MREIKSLHNLSNKYLLIKNPAVRVRIGAIGILFPLVADVLLIVYMREGENGFLSEYGSLVFNLILFAVTMGAYMGATFVMCILYNCYVILFKNGDKKV